MLINRHSVATASALLAGLLTIGGLGTVACSPSNTDADDGPLPSTDDAGGGSDSGSTTDGGHVEVPEPVFCPETNPFSPKNPSSVVVSDVVLQQDETWTADKVYLIGDDFKIENHTLTVEAGTTICLYQKGKIYVGQGIDPGEIHLNGTKDKPIVITVPPKADDPTKPDVFHRGIQFDTYLGSKLSYVNIWYGGPGGGSASPAFEITNTAHGTPDVKKPLLVDHLVVGAVQSKGIRIGTDLGIAEGSAIQFTGFGPRDGTSPALDAVAEIDLGASKSVAAAWNMAGATIPDEARHVNLKNRQTEGKIQVDTDLVDFGLPYLWKNHLVMQVAGMQDDPIGPTFTIHEGVTLHMDGVLIIGGTSGTANGNLVIAGTAAKPVTLTSTSATPASGDWEGLYFVTDHYDRTKTKIDHAEILYAGVDPSNGQQINNHVGRCGANFVGAIMITGSGGTQFDGPMIRNTKIAHSKSDGIVSDANTSNGFCKTDYGAASLNNAFEDIAGQQLRNGTCL